MAAIGVTASEGEGEAGVSEGTAAVGSAATGPDASPASRAQSAAKPQVLARPSASRLPDAFPRTCWERSLCLPPVRPWRC